jgi:hypothetical protein
MKGATNLDLIVSGDGKFLYTLDSGTGYVSVYSINSDGALNQLGDIEGLPKTVGFNGIAGLNGFLVTRCGAGVRPPHIAPLSEVGQHFVE